MNMCPPPPIIDLPASRLAVSFAILYSAAYDNVSNHIQCILQLNSGLNDGLLMQQTSELDINKIRVSKFLQTFRCQHG